MFASPAGRICTPSSRSILQGLLETRQQINFKAQVCSNSSTRALSQRKMSTQKVLPFEKIVLPATSDFHVHLRQPPLTAVVTPTITKGGVSTVYVMPNTVPPITTVSQAIAYKEELKHYEPSVDYLMTLYLHPDVTPSTISDAAQAGIKGVKIYPAGVTTNSDAGVLDLEPYYPVFEAMQSHGLILNLHGEVGCTCETGPEYIHTPSTDPTNPGAITTLNAEHAFLPTLLDLHKRFPRLRIVLEHASTAAALDAVRICGPNVAGTITAHHLFLTADDVLGDGHNFCKPVAKQPSDRVALIREVVNPTSKFFFGSDSAPHPEASKVSNGIDKKAAAGCFTQPYATQLVIAALERGVECGWIDGSSVNQTILSEFLSRRGRRFYGLDSERRRISLEKRGETVEAKTSDGNITVPNWGAAKDVWSLDWVK